MDSSTTRSFWMPALSLTFIASELAPTVTAIPLQLEKVAQCNGKNADC